MTITEQYQKENPWFHNETSFPFTKDQLDWLKALQTSRKHTGSLGTGTIKDYKACCLGVACVVLYGENIFSNKKIVDNKGGFREIVRGSAGFISDNTMLKLNLRSMAGEDVTHSNRSLATMNDFEDLSHKEIADELMTTPSHFFNNLQQ